MLFKCWVLKMTMVECRVDVDRNEALTERLHCAVKRHPVLPKTNLANKITW